MSLEDFDNGNDVLGTLKDLATDGLRTYRDVQMSKARGTPTQTTSAPAGAPWYSNFNPFPNMFSAYPQADAKSGSRPVAAGTSFAPLMLIGAVILVVLLAFRR